jgi:hypothetical protein
MQDISSSDVAKGIASLFAGAITSVVVDMGIVIQVLAKTIS